MTDYETKLLPAILRAIAEERSDAVAINALNHAAEALETMHDTACNELSFALGWPNSTISGPLAWHDLLQIVERLRVHSQSKNITIHWNGITPQTPPSPPSSDLAGATSGTDPETSPTQES